MAGSRDRVPRRVNQAILIASPIIAIFMEKANFPLLLEHTRDRPKTLYSLGQPLVPDAPYFAVVGTRRPSMYGKEMAEKFSFEMAQLGFTIVSGLAYGIDSIAHDAALRAHGKTVAVLGFGFDYLKNIHDKKLTQRIQEQGTIITEYEDHIAPAKFTFPRRNRIIAGMSLATLVIEAPENSGALITARQAMEYHREVFVLPANITQQSSAGGNRLIQSSSAFAVTSVAEILEIMETGALGLHTQTITAESNGHTLTDDEAFLYEMLKNSPMHIDGLAIETGWEVSRITTTLAFLELKGFVTLSGSYAFITR